MKKRPLTTILLTALAAASIHAQSGLTVSVHCDEPGTLFVKIMEQIEEVGELKDVTSLTVSGTLGNDDVYVQRDQLPNLLSADFSSIDADGAKYVYMNGHRRLKRCVLPTAATELRSNVLSGCDSLTTVVMPPGLLTIPYSFASGCKQLATIDIPQSVTKIENGAFSDCTSFTSVTIPAGVTELYQTFYGCTSLSSVTFLSSNVTLGNNTFRGTAFETFTLPQGFVINGSGAFSNCTSLKSFTFPDGLTDEKQVGSGTFDGCSQLQQVRLPADLTVIPEGFFRGTAITSLNLPASVTTINREAYRNTKALKQAVLPTTLRNIAVYAFWGSGLETVVWPESVTTMNSEVFRDCQQLTSVIIPSTVDSIGSGVFLYCSALTSIHLPEGIRTLNNTFSGCTSLSEVNIPSTVTYLASSVFAKCKALSHIDIPDGVTYIGTACFEDAPLTEVRLPSKLRQMDGTAFNGCQYKRMVVPEGVISIGERAFRSDSLRVLDLPSTLLSVGGCMLGDNGQHHPDSVILRAMVPPYSNRNFLISRDCPTTLYVPQASLELYQANAAYNTVESIKPLNIGQSHLNIIGKVAITPMSSLQQAKYDVDMVTLHDIAGIVQSSDSHPSLTIDEGATFRIGQLNMTFDANTNWSYRQTRYDCFINHGTTTIDDIDLRCLFTSKYFFTPPFDVKVDNIIGENPNTPITFYRYDGAARASTDFQHTWVRIMPGETLHPGTGYAVLPEQQLYQDYTGKWGLHWGYYHMKPLAGGINHFSTSDDISVPLQHHASEFPHNRNWNLVGMPFPAFLDIRGMDYDGPVFILSQKRSESSQWKAFSALDDEIVLYPHEALFIQCPDDVSAVTFSADRRQVDGTFVKGTTQNSRQALRRADLLSRRVVYNAMLSRFSGESDTLQTSTRFVINPAATTGYDIGRDAPLMANDDTDVPATLLYTHSQGLAYAINERPLADGIVHLGMQLAEEGTYTLSLSMKGSRMAGEFSADTPVWLIDNEEHTRTLLTPSSEEKEGVSYTFTATAGSHPQRFTIALGDAEPTEIDTIEAPSGAVAGAFNLLGQPVSPSAKGVYIKDGKIIVR